MITGHDCPEKHATLICAYKTSSKLAPSLIGLLQHQCFKIQRLGYSLHFLSPQTPDVTETRSSPWLLDIYT